MQLGLDSMTSSGPDVEPLNAIARVTGGNFRLLHRLFAQIERLLAVNNIAAVTTDVVDAAVRASSSAAPLTNVQLSAN